MKDLSREEKIEQEISRLERLIAEKDDAFDEEQGKRLKRTFFVLSGVIYFIALSCILDSGTGDIDIKAILAFFVISPIMAGFVMLISFGVWWYVMNGALRRVETLAELKGELFAIKYRKYTDYEDDSKRQLGSLKAYLKQIIGKYRDLELNGEYEDYEDYEDQLEAQLEDLKCLLEKIEYRLK